MYIHTYQRQKHLVRKVHRTTEFIYYYYDNTYVLKLYYTIVETNIHIVFLFKNRIYTYGVILYDNRTQQSSHT